MRYIFKAYIRFLSLLNIPVILAEFFQSKTGREFGINLIDKIFLIFKINRNNKRIISASGGFEHRLMISKILNIPKSMEGCIVECGCYKGGSSANLSIIADITDRKLEIFDSFKGLPEPSSQDKEHILMRQEEIHTYTKGEWNGSLEEVKENISKYGKIQVCNFNKGYFDDTLPTFKKKCVFIFLDVDLRSSMETCLKYLWPLLQDGGYLFTHEAHHIEIASLFYDNEWWQKNLNSIPPGLVGAGNGLGLNPQNGGYTSAIGYIIKNPDISTFETVPQIGKLI